jgi:2-C-methyl-D-erythritol 2,4-cyclodiphosphate synthase
VEYADMTIVAQKPKISPYIEEIRTSVAEVLDIPRDRVNVKATTEEKMGFTGRGEGISAHAVCLLGE